LRNITCVVRHRQSSFSSIGRKTDIGKFAPPESRRLAEKDTELLAKQAGTYDDSELCKRLLEISLLDLAYQRSTTSRDDILMDAAKRYRVDAEKLQKAVAKEFAAKRDRKTRLKAKGRTKTAV
jgi:hypothetical protein